MKKLLIILTSLLLILINQTTATAYDITDNGIAGISVTLNKSTPKETYLWTTDRVNLRSEASTNSDIVVTLDTRTKVQMISSSKEWTKVTYKDKSGYVSSKFLRDKELPSTEFTDEEIDLLAKIVWLESRGESDEGVAGVCLVIRNRVLSTEFSDTITEVLSDKTGKYYEFSTWKSRDTAKPDDRIYEIIEEVMRGDWDDLLSEDYVYFSTTARNNNGTKKIGNHFFCKY